MWCGWTESGFETANVNPNANDIRERCKTKMKVVTGIGEVDDDLCEGSHEKRKREDEVEFGERKTTLKHDPRQPSEQERIEHEMTHLALRSWCRHCVN